jgi:hypothetical protein
MRIDRVEGEEQMKSLRMLVLLMAVVGTAVGAATATAGGGHDSCMAVSGRAIGQNLGGGHTMGTIVHAGMFNGTTEAQLTITGGHPPIVTFTGTGTLTTHQGTITITPIGTLNQATGEFQATAHITGGTGLFAHATGDLTLVGVEQLPSGSFSQTISGTVCLAH